MWGPGGRLWGNPAVGSRAAMEATKDCVAWAEPEVPICCPWRRKSPTSLVVQGTEGVVLNEQEAGGVGPSKPMPGVRGSIRVEPQAWVR